MSAFFRKRIEETIEHMLQTFDDMDEDPDLEEEPREEQNDIEADPSAELAAHRPSMNFVLAEMARRKKTVLR